MKYVLIWVIYASTGVTSGSQEFLYKTSCEAAQAEFVRLNESYSRTVITQCSEYNK